jgi:hypothetical protein
MKDRGKKLLIISVGAREEKKSLVSPFSFDYFHSTSPRLVMFYYDPTETASNKQRKLFFDKLIPKLDRSQRAELMATSAVTQCRLSWLWPRKI